LIEGTVKKIKDGSALVAKTNEAFAEVAVGTSKVGELVGEIAAASQEQDHGIDQISKAVVEMDKVTQQTAANAEESASASEEMNAQAEQMKNISYELVNIIGGSINDDGNIAQTDVKAKKGIRVAIAAVTAKREKGKDVMSLKRSREVHPDQVIPMKEGQFKDF
jgi:methyl-accepting chemotaxis protein